MSGNDFFYVTLLVMKHFRKELWFDISQRRQLLNITPQIDACVKESQIQEGMVLVNSMHISSSVFINDDESDVSDLSDATD